MVVAYNSFYTRDVLCGLLTSLIVVATFSICCVETSREFLAGNRASRFFLISALVALPAIRSDEIIVVLGVIVILAVATPHLRRRLAVVALAAVFAGQVVVRVAETRMMPEPVRNRYQLTALMGTLGALYAKRTTSFSPDEVATIARVIDPAVCRSEWTPHSLEYWRNIDSCSVSREELRAFRRIVVTHSFRFPEVVVSAHAETFLGILGITGDVPWRLSDFSREGRFHTKEIRDQRVWREHPDRLYTWQSDLIWNSVAAADAGRTPGELLQRVAWSSLLQLLIIIFAAVAYRWAPVTAALSATELARMAIFFFFAPATHTFYVYDLYLVGIIVPVLFAIELRRRSLAGTLSDCVTAAQERPVQSGK